MSVKYILWLNVTQLKLHNDELYSEKFIATELISPFCVKEGFYGFENFPISVNY